MKKMIFVEKGSTFIYSRNKKFTNLSNSIPVHPSSDPYYGNLLEIDKAGGFHSFLSKCHLQYGPVFYFWMKADKVASVGHPKLWRSMRTVQEKTDHFRQFFQPLFKTNELIDYVNGDSREERYRKHYNPVLNQDTVNNYHFHTFSKNSKKLSTRIRALQNQGKSVSINQLFGQYIVENMIEIIFGETGLEDNLVIKVYNALKDSLIYAELNVFTSKRNEEEEREFNINVSFVHDFIKSTMNKRANKGSHNPAVLFDLLYNSNPHNVVFGDCVSMLYTASLAVISNLIFSTYHLVKNKSVLEILKSEIASSMERSDDICIKSIQKMKFLRACINESLRLSPTVSTAGRVAHDNIDLGNNLVIPKDTPIVFPLGMIMNDASLWKDPEKFNPSRFKEDQIKFSIQYSPFGFAGGRVCPGVAITRLEAQIALARIFKEFDFELENESQMMNVFDITFACPKEDIFLKIHNKSF